MAGIKQGRRSAHQPVHGCLKETFWREKIIRQVPPGENVQQHICYQVSQAFTHPSLLLNTILPGNERQHLASKRTQENQSFCNSALIL